MSYLKLGAMIFAFLVATASVRASESDELRKKAETMQREAAELSEQGHEEEAAKLNRKAMAMLEEAEGLQPHRPDQREAEIMRTKKLLEKLRQKEKELKEVPNAGEVLDIVRREAEQVEMKLRELDHQPHREHRGPDEEIARRLEHMRIAVEHLNHAGLRDIAEHVAERAEVTERDLHERHRDHEGDAIHEIMKQLDEIRYEVGRLRDEVNELKEKR